MATKKNSENGGIRVMKEADFDKQIAQKVKDQEITPPSLVWSNIVGVLDKPEQKSAKKRYLSYTNLAIAAALLLFIGVAIKLFNIKEAPNKSALITQNSWTQNDLGSAKDQNETPSVTSRPDEITQELIPTAEQGTSMQASATDKKEVQKQEPHSINHMASQTTKTVKSNKKHLELAPTVIAFAAQDVQLAQVASAVNQNRPNLEVVNTSEIAYTTEIIPQERKNKPNILVMLLNTVTQSINPTQQELSFNQDEEGTIKVDFSNSLVKN